MCTGAGGTITTDVIRFVINVMIPKSKIESTIDKKAKHYSIGFGQ